MMYALNIVLVFTLVAFTSANPHQRPDPVEETDADLFRQFIECARLAIVTGIPEIEVPSHDPLIITHDVNEEINLAPLFSGSFSLDNMIIKDIPNWEVRQFDQLSANDDGVETFNYTIYWRDMVFTGDYKYDFNIFDLHFENEGTITFEFDHLNFIGVFNFTKSGPTRSQTINDVDLHVTTEEVHFDVTNLGAISDLIHDSGEDLVSLINTLDYTELSDALKNKLINDWILKQERLDAIISHCQT